MTGIFMSLSRVLPDRYPLGDDVETYVEAEFGLSDFVAQMILGGTAGFQFAFQLVCLSLGSVQHLEAHPLRDHLLVEPEHRLDL